MSSRFRRSSHPWTSRRQSAYGGRGQVGAFFVLGNEAERGQQHVVWHLSPSAIKFFRSVALQHRSDRCCGRQQRHGHCQHGVSAVLLDGRGLTLEEQPGHPHPDEMNLPWSEAVARLQADETATAYPQLFDAFGTSEITADLVSKAIAQFVRTMVSADSKFDKWRRGEVELTDSGTVDTKCFCAKAGSRWCQAANLGRTAFTATERPVCNSPTTCFTTTVWIPLSKQTPVA